MHQNLAKLVHNNHIVAKIFRHETDIAWTDQLRNFIRHEPRSLSQQNHEIKFSL
jgi:hypothetical protein